MHIYTEEDIEANFDSGTLRRGLAYAKNSHVLKVEAAGEDRIRGTVCGRSGYLYQTEVSWVLDDYHDIIFDSSCSCPVLWNCKHAVAILAAYLNHANHDDPYQAWLNTQGQTLLPPRLDTPKQNDTLLLCFMPDSQGKPGVVKLEAGVVRRLKSGKWGKFKPVEVDDLQSSWRYDAISPEEKRLLSLFENRANFRYSLGCDLNSEHALYALRRLLKQNKVCWQASNQCLSLAETRTLTASWQDCQGDKTLHLSLSDTCTDWALLMTPTPWYLDPDTLTVGPIETELSTVQLKSLGILPTLNAEQAGQFTDDLDELLPASLPRPAPSRLPVIEAPLQPHLALRRGREGEPLIYAVITFQYGEHALSPAIALRPEIGKITGHHGEVSRLIRDHEAELAHYQHIQAMPLLPADQRDDEWMQPLLLCHQAAFAVDELRDWCDFHAEWLPRLQREGWQVTLADDLFLDSVTVTALDAHIEEQGAWFDLGLSLEIDGEKVELLPLLLTWLKAHHDWQQQDDIWLPREGAAPLKIAKAALRPILQLLQELTELKGDRLRLNNTDAVLLGDLPVINHWVGGDRIKQLADKLNNFSGMTALPAPSGLQAQLRDYQQLGLNWLNFLQEYGFGGILADDMGLGKTLQTLALLQHHYEQRTLTQPALIICPTSLVGNWASEADRFTPALKVLILYGPKRKPLYSQIAAADLVICTYPLVVRDIELLTQHAFSFLVLDEAQTIKNPTAKVAQYIRQLKAAHRLCLTGTPMENHLGELWAQFDFLMPGFLGSGPAFNQRYRKPIEQLGDKESKAWLQQKIRPFMLRRTKDQVANELPPKTEIIHSIPLPPAQRTLYESIRVTMEARVRELLATKGLAKSQIEFLDALLKLRQACCDPALVKLDSAKDIKQSAKLDFLMERLPEMVEEGRKILIFSQFTQMLGLIEARLKQASIGYSKLTGQTRKRHEAIARFQEGEVPVFLISLKAGGVGLNLTQADTVIHFDPWWNPAAENQATDRAYRIGQDKPVFVYKLICEKTVEEKVLALQQKKQQLADSVYGEEQESSLALNDKEVLLALFERM